MIKKKILLLVACLYFVGVGKAQKIYHLTPENSCFFSNVAKGAYLDIVSEPGTQQAVDFLNQVVDQIALASRFNINMGNLRGQIALAYYEDNTQVIFVDKKAVEKIKQDLQSSWPEVFIIAHEIAHHMNRDMDNGDPINKEDELRADKFAGYVLYKMGATRYQTLNALRALNYKYSDTHPPVEKRKEAASSGWEKAYNETSKQTNGRSNVTGNLEERYDLVKNVFSIVVKENPIDRYARWDLIYKYVPISFSVENYVARNNLTSNQSFNVQLAPYKDKPIIWFNAFTTCNCIADIDVPKETVINTTPQSFRLVNFRKFTQQGVAGGQCIGMSNMYFAGGWEGSITLSVDNEGNILISNMVLEAYRSANQFSARGVSYRYTAHNIVSAIKFEDKP